MGNTHIYRIGLLCLLLILGLKLQGQSIDSLSLKNVDNSMVNIGQYKSKKALVLVFTGNHCVYSKKYEARLIRIAEAAAERDIAFCLVNSNDPEMSDDDRFVIMQQRATENKYPCPYLQDVGGVLANLLNATKNPEVFVLKHKDSEWGLLYSGKIDDNPLIEARVENKYLLDVLDRIAKGDFSPSEAIPAVGCNIKMKE